MKTKKRLEPYLPYFYGAAFLALAAALLLLVLRAVLSSPISGEKKLAAVLVVLALYNAAVIPVAWRVFTRIFQE